MDFLGFRSPPPPTASSQRPCERTASPRQGMPLLAPRDDDDDHHHHQQHSRLATLSLHSPVPLHAVNPDVPAAAHRQNHPTARPSQVHAITANLGFQSAMPTSFPQGSRVVHNAASTTTPRSLAAPNPTAQLTIFYDDSVHVFDNVTREKAEKIVLMAAKATQASSPAAVRWPLLQSESAAIPDEKQMMAAAKACDDSGRLCPDTVHAIIDKASPQAVLMPRDVPLARNASLAHFRERRKQRVTSAAMPHSRRQKYPGKMDTFPMVSPGSKILPFGNMEQSWVSGSAKSNDEEALDTELKI